MYLSSIYLSLNFLYRLYLLNKYAMSRKDSNSTVRIQLHYLGRLVYLPSRSYQEVIIFSLPYRGLERIEEKKIKSYGCERGEQKFQNLLKRSSLKKVTRMGTLDSCSIAGRNWKSLFQNILSGFPSCAHTSVIHSPAWIQCDKKKIWLCHSH